MNVDYGCTLKANEKNFILDGNKPLGQIVFDRNDLFKLSYISIDIGGQPIITLDIFWIRYLIKKSTSQKINILSEFINEIPMHLLEYHEVILKITYLDQYLKQYEEAVTFDEFKSSNSITPHIHFQKFTIKNGMLTQEALPPKPNTCCLYLSKYYHCDGMCNCRLNNIKKYYIRRHDNSVIPKFIYSDVENENDINLNTPVDIPVEIPIINDDDLKYKKKWLRFFGGMAGFIESK